jgi:hypothetical protein
MFKFQIASILTGTIIGVLAIWLLISAPDWATRYLAIPAAHPSGIDSFRFVGSWMMIVALLLLAVAIAPPAAASQRLLALAATVGLALLTVIHVQVLLSDGDSQRWLPPLKMDTVFFGVLTLYWTIVSWSAWQAGD